MSDHNTMARIRHQREVDAEAAKEARLEQFKKDAFITSAEIHESLFKFDADANAVNQLCVELHKWMAVLPRPVQLAIREICADAINKRAQEWLEMEGEKDVD